MESKVEALWVFRALKTGSRALQADALRVRGLPTGNNISARVEARWMDGVFAPGVSTKEGKN